MRKMNNKMIILFKKILEKTAKKEGENNGQQQVGRS